MPHYIYIPILILCAPFILSVVALAIITIFFLIVISIRLGFLAIEFSCGLVLDFIRFCINSLLGENPYNKHVKKNEIKDKLHYKLTVINLVYQRLLIIRTKQKKV